MSDSPVHHHPFLLPPPPPPPHLSITPPNPILQSELSSPLPPLPEEPDLELLEQQQQHDETPERDNNNNNEQQQKDLKRRRYILCCAWIMFSLLAAAFITLITFLLFIVSVRSALPEFSVIRAEFRRLHIGNRKELDCDVHVVIQAMNMNRNVGIEYGKLSVNTTAFGGVKLGKSRIGGFVQGPMESRDLKMRMRVRNGVVKEEDGIMLREKVKKKEMVFNVFLRVKIGLHVVSFFGMKVWVPCLVACHDIEQVQLDFGAKTKCNIQIFKFEY